MEYTSYSETIQKKGVIMNLIPIKVVAKHALVIGATFAIITVAYDTIILLNKK